MITDLSIHHDEPYDPGEPFDLNRYPPATAADLALQQAVRELVIPAPPADAWAPLLQDFADRAPAHRALWQDLARRVRDAQPPALPADTWPPRQAALNAALTEREQRLAADSAWLAAQVRALPVPPASDEQWAYQTEALQINLARSKSESDRIARLARETPVEPQTTDPAAVRSDWLAVESAIREGHTDTPPAVAPQRWDRMWNRIQTRIDPAAAAAPTSAAAPTATSAPTQVIRPRHGWGRWAAAGAIAAAAAVALLAVILARPHDPIHPTTPELPPPQTAVLESAEIVDMGTVDDSVTTVVRTTSGDNPVTVVVIVNQ